MGSAGDSPAPVGDPPTGTAERDIAKRPCPFAQTAALVPSGESPDGTGGSPVLPRLGQPATSRSQLRRKPPPGAALVAEAEVAGLKDLAQDLQ